MVLFQNNDRQWLVSVTFVTDGCNCDSYIFHIRGIFLKNASFSVFDILHANRKYHSIYIFIITNKLTSFTWITPIYWILEIHVCVSAELSSRSNRRFCQRNAMLWRCIRRHELSAFDNSCQHELFLCLMWAYLIVINCYKWIGSVINT